MNSQLRALSIAHSLRVRLSQADAVVVALANGGAIACCPALVEDVRTDDLPEGVKRTVLANIFAYQRGKCAVSLGTETFDEGYVVWTSPIAQILSRARVFEGSPEEREVIAKLTLLGILMARMRVIRHCEFFPMYRPYILSDLPGSKDPVIFLDPVLREAVREKDARTIDLSVCWHRMEAHVGDMSADDAYDRIRNAFGMLANVEPT